MVLAAALLVSAESTSSTKLSDVIVLIVFGLALGLWNLAIVANFRGYRDNRTRRMLRMMRSSTQEGSRAHKFTSAMQIGVGVAFLIAAVGMITLGVVSLVT